MPWHTQYLNMNDPRYASLSRLTTGRPAWVIKGTVAVAALVFAVPLIALAVLMVGALAITALAWTVLSGVSKLIDAVTANKSAKVDRPTPPTDDGRENVWVKER